MVEPEPVSLRDNKIIEGKNVMQTRRVSYIGGSGLSCPGCYLIEERERGAYEAETNSGKRILEEMILLESPMDGRLFIIRFIRSPPDILGSSPASSSLGNLKRRKV